LKQFYFLICLFASFNIYGQAPSITYSTPQIYNVGTSIAPLIPTNSGGNVPASIYSFVSTFSGTNHPGFTNGTVNTASYNQPRDVTVDLSGNTYIVDDNNVIRKVTPAGVVTTFAGSGALGSANGTGTAASFKNLLGIITDAAGNVYVTDSNNMIRKITPTGVVTTLAGNGTSGSANGPGASASFKTPLGIGIDAAGNLYVADMFNNMIRKITPTGVVSTVAGNVSYGAADGPANSATFSQPEDVTVDAQGNLYVADAGNNKIRKISTSGIVTTLAGSGQQGNADGTGAAASFYFPTAITIDAAGNLYVADALNQTIRKVTPAGSVTTIAGSTNGTYGYADGIGRAAKFSYPYGIGTNGSDIYIADNQNSDIRKLSLSGYTISPNLPSGLVFDATTGIITGTPTVTSAATNYTITAYNNYGSSITTINIAITALQPQYLTFLPLPVKTYGDVDFNANAISSNPTTPLTYVSSNTSVATISATGSIHIAGAGSTTITVSQSGDAVYASASPVSQTLIVNKAIVIIKANDQIKNYGSSDPVFTVNYSGFVFNDNASVLTQAPIATSNATVLSPAGTYTISVAGAIANNYSFNYLPSMLTVNQANLLIIGDNKIKKYGQPNPPLTITYTGFLNGDTFLNLTIQPNIVTTADISSTPGNYNISVSGAQSSNYQTSYTNGILTVNKATQTITFNVIQAKTVGDADFFLTATSSAGLPVTYASSAPDIAKIKGNQVNILKAGRVTITASQAGNTNYEAAGASQILVISPLAITMANTITPNSDGVNDTWNIVGLELDNTASVSIYNRYGLLVFQNIGYYLSPWDGSYHGKRLPVGTYYYIISAKNNSRRFSGPISLIY
jgi:gliding motility-associated-like protein